MKNSFYTDYRVLYDEFAHAICTLATMTSRTHSLWAVPRHYEIQKSAILSLIELCNFLENFCSFLSLKEV